MSDKPQEPDASPWGGLVPVGLGAAVVCCAGGPLIVSVLGGVALGTVLGVGAGVLAMALVATVVVVRGRHSRGASRRVSTEASLKGQERREL